MEYLVLVSAMFLVCLSAFDSFDKTIVAAVSHFGALYVIVMFLLPEPFPIDAPTFGLAIMLWLAFVAKWVLPLLFLAVKIREDFRYN